MVGINQGLIGIPFDTIKVWMQNNHRIFGRPLTHYYRGIVPDMTNAIITNSIVFPIHSYSLPYTHNSFLSGGIAGIANWGLIYPLDTLKNRQIGKNISFMKAYNMGSLYKGYSICITRAFLVNAINFFVYENVFMYLDDKE